MAIRPSSDWLSHILPFWAKRPFMQSSGGSQRHVQTMQNVSDHYCVRMVEFFCMLFGSQVRWLIIAWDIRRLAELATRFCCVVNIVQSSLLYTSERLLCRTFCEIMEGLLTGKARLIELLIELPSGKKSADHARMTFTAQCL